MEKSMEKIKFVYFQVLPLKKKCLLQLWENLMSKLCGFFWNLHISQILSRFCLAPKSSLYFLFHQIFPVVEKKKIEKIFFGPRISCKKISTSKSL